MQKPDSEAGRPQANKRRRISEDAEKAEPSKSESPEEDGESEQGESESEERSREEANDPSSDLKTRGIGRSRDRR